jgi:hypothetical protein
MQKLLVTCGLALWMALIAGCATTNPGLGDEAGNATLPSGVTLLDSDDGECEGAVQVSEHGIDGEGEGLDDEFYVEAGENATFELDGDDEEIEWACVSDDGDFDEESMDCPSGATHVRITRASTGDELLVECYGG